MTVKASDRCDRTSTTQKYQDALKTVCKEANAVFAAYRQEDSNFTHNQVTVIGDVVGSLLAYDILCSKDEEEHDLMFDFVVDKFFSFGSPIGNLVLHRALQGKPVHPKKVVTQFYNLFYASSPGATRIEPILDGHFASFPPVCIPRFNKVPFGAGSQYSITSFLENNQEILQKPIQSINPTMSSDLAASPPNSCVKPISTSSLGLSGVSEWWGNKRIDYALYYPEALRSFPSLILPTLLHSSYWENYDVAAFVVQQVLGIDEMLPMTSRSTTPRSTLSDISSNLPSTSTEKWLKRRTKLKVNNLNPNHRCFDTICLEGLEQEITAKFFYGPLDALSLVGEKVDINIMENNPGGEWKYLGTQMTGQGGRINFKIPDKLGTGLYPVKCTVKGDKSAAEGFMAVVPPNTECVVFSIDGSFTLNVSLMGRDAKIRPGAVEVVRLWQELGFVIIYITARPDMQKESVVQWLGTHNFPHGIVAFSDGISPTDLLKHKMEYLIRLTNECKMSVYAAYGSSKDINVYLSAGIPLSKMYIVKPKNPKRKHQVNWINHLQFSDHLQELKVLAPRSTTWTRVPISGDLFRFPTVKRVSRCGTIKRQFSASKNRTDIPILSIITGSTMELNEN